MTREEFTDIVHNELQSYGDCYLADRIIDAADKYALEQEPCDYAINREYTMTALRADLSFICPNDKLNAIRIVEGMPPVTQKQKMGHWIRELIRNEKGGCIGVKMICSECGNDNKHDEYMKFCPNCDMKMKRNDKE